MSDKGDGGAGMSLGEMLTADNGGGSAADWVKRNRVVTAVRASHQEREKKSVKTKGGDGYSARDLAGIEVQHGEEEFVEGQDVILTLKDSRILDEKGMLPVAGAFAPCFSRRCCAAMHAPMQLILQRCL